MPQLKDLWVGMETRKTSGAGTNSKVSLTVTTNNRERLRHTFQDTRQEDLERGQANLYPINVATKGIDSESLTSDSIAIRIDGGDEWSPRNVVVWGRSNVGAVIPLAIRTDITQKMKGDDSLPIPLLVKPADPSRMSINRLLMLMLTADVDEAGTPHGISIQINSGSTVVVDADVTNTSQGDQDRAQANMYFVGVKSAFTKRSLGAGSIALRILGDNAWTPGQFFLFGLDERTGRPGSLVPLVHVPSWSLGPLSTDINEGKPRVTLPLA